VEQLECFLWSATKLLMHCPAPLDHGTRTVGSPCNFAKLVHFLAIVGPAVTIIAVMVGIVFIIVAIVT
jgi:hypothetical protein